MNFRPASVPLVTVDPFFSIWSCNDKLYEGVTRHWTGRPNPMSAGVIVDGRIQMLMGEINHDSNRKRNRYQRYVEQKEVIVTPTRTTYLFENDILSVTLVFTTPLLLDNLKIMSRPVSYVEYDIKVVDGKEHEISFWFDISGECSIDEYYPEVTLGKGKNSVYCGNSNQKVLSYSGDNVCINWGYLHLADRDAKIIDGRTKNELNWCRLPRELEDEKCIMFEKYPYLSVKKDEPHGVVVVAYDDVKSIEYFGDRLDGYYRKFYSSFDEMLECAMNDYDEVKALCEAFDKKLMDEASKISLKYEKLTSAAYRQAIAAHKLVEDRDGNLIFLSKECDSNGCIGTLDVTYPSIPLFLKFNPEFVLGMLRPIIKYAQSDMWEKDWDFAPHDVGQYPLANGQVYGMNKETKEERHSMQMPVEECGNMLLCVAAAMHYGSDSAFAQQNEEILTKWTDYLIREGYDPGNQLCTDDFAGHLAHNCNLSLKAILGIAAYGKIYNKPEYIEKAAVLAKNWQKDAKNSTATRLAFDVEDSWSLKYNIVWDKLLNINIFDEKVFADEVALYKTKMNPYGIPLDCRDDYTKVDWLVWTTVMTNDKEYAESVFDSIINYANSTPDRAPMTDWYYTSIPRIRAFQNRTVVGGIFINLL
ncbi:MAG: DUF4965 domain-containing protein [Clostridia bacterium]|nr:DUF4965 domain-containing protein [Clostridia bacterium]